MSTFLRTNEYSEAISSLKFFVEIIPSINEDIYRWKWAIIALHNAVQGFMVLSLKGTDSLLILPDKQSTKWLDAYYNDQPLPEERLDNFLHLFNKIQQYRNFPTSAQYQKHLEKLNSIRNNFIHFSPKNWSLEISGLPAICMDCLHVIHYLVEQEEILWYQKEVQQQVLSSVNKAKKVLTNLYQ